MKHTVIFTPIFSTIYFIGLSSFLLFATQHAAAIDCMPDGYNTKEEYVGCPNLNKRATWTVVFPGAQYTVHPEGTGKCASGHPCCDQTLRTTECWPAFNQPEEVDGKWSVRVTNKTTQTTTQACSFGCFNEIKVSCVATSNTTFKVEHTCTSGGSGGGEGECLATGATCFNNPECCSGVCGDGQCGDAQVGGSPVLVDVLGNGFSLTNALGGVDFDLNADGVRERISWTAAGTDDAWLTLDRNGNGTVDGGTELFGNFTAQPAVVGTEKNGFVALAEFDRPANGGNNDGVITQADAVFASLRLWQDANHDGISEPSELRELPATRIEVLELDYRLSQRTDKYGNQFRYRAKLKDAHGSQLGRWAWDVFLLVSP